jgi:hypothetical protein
MRFACRWLWLFVAWLCRLWLKQVGRVVAAAAAVAADLAPAAAAAGGGGVA